MTDRLFDPDFIATENAGAEPALRADHDALGEHLARRGIDIGGVTAKVAAFGVAIPSWGVGTGGTRFARFPGPGEPRSVWEKLDDCAAIQTLAQATPRVSLHIPWDLVDDAAALGAYGAARGLGFDAMNSNTFQDAPGQARSYKFGSLSHTDAATRDQAVEHNLGCITFGLALGSKALTVWIADGSNFPGQSHFARAFERYLDSMARIYAELPEDWRLFSEHKVHEPAFYSTVVQDWGTNLMTVQALGERAFCLVDLGHHAPNANIEMVVARLIQAGKLGGFHFNDSKYGDDDLDTGAIEPYRLFLVFNELVAAGRRDPDLAPAHMLDQSHNVTDPIESLMASVEACQRALLQALIVDRDALAEAQAEGDALAATRLLQRAFATDVSPLLAEWRRRNGGAIDPIAAYRLSGYRDRVAAERPASAVGTSGIV
jgi:L-rhamnose isomerase/sugar isomerase